MATTTVPRRGNGGKGSGRDGDGPPRSFPSRQRKLGPAPIASFEDLSDDNDSSPPDPDLNKIKPMPEIREDGIRSPEDENTGGGLQFGKTTVIPGGGSMVTSTSNPSGPTSGLQTPSTPRIDISCASSSTPPSEESNSEKELFPGGLGLAFNEEGTDDLRSSTEELEFGAEDEIHEGRKGRKEIEDPFRRASHPANIFQRKVSLTPTDEDLLQRKPSAHSLYLEGFLSRPCRHSSFGSADRQRPGALSSLSNDGRRSASPNTMLLETSFCGNKPIPTPSMDLDSPPREGKGGKTGGSGGNGDKAGKRNNTGMLSSDSSFESHKPQKMTATVQVHSHDNSIIHERDGSGNKSSSSISSLRKENRENKNPGSPLSDEGRNARKKSHPHLQSPDSPKSSDHWKPISPKPEKSTTSIISSPIQPPLIPPTATHITSSAAAATVTKTPKVERKFFPDSFEAAMANSAPVIAKAAERAQQEKARVEGAAKQSSSPRSGRFMKEESMELIQKISLKSLGKKSAVEEGAPGSPGMRRKNEKPVAQEVCTRWPEPEVELIGNIVGQSVERVEKSERVVGGGAGRTRGEITEEEVNEEEGEITTEMKFSEDGNISVEDVPIETKSFFQDSLDDEEDLPYVPTTLPLEKSVAIPILPIKERRKLGNLVETNPIQRPRCVRPPNPKALDDFIAAAASSGFPEESFADFSSTSFNNPKAEASSTVVTTSKMKINLPREDSLPDPNNPNSPRPKSPKTKLPTSWADFAEMGLRSPREIRRQMRENNGAENSGSSPATPAAPTAIGIGAATTTDDVVSYQSDSCSEDIGAPAHDNGASDEETESLLKLPKVPFAMDLDVHSNRSSVISQEVNSPSASAQNEIPEDIDEDDEQLSCESP